MTRIQIYKDSILIHEVDTIAEVCELVGWDEEKARRVLKWGNPFEDINLESVVKNFAPKRPVVIAYKEGQSKAYTSWRACSKETGVSRTKIKRLIEHGTATSDGITFDIPCHQYDDEEEYGDQEEI